jgi:glutaredoxin-related protein
MKRKHKQYFIYYLKESVLIFDVFDYIEELAADYVDYCYEWNVVKNDIVSEKRELIKSFLETNFACFSLVNLSKNEKLGDYKTFFYYKEKNELNKWTEFFKNPEKFIKISKSFLKKRLKNFIEIKEDVQLFQNIKGEYEKLPCLLPTGEDETFLLKTVKKLK